MCKAVPDTWPDRPLLSGEFIAQLTAVEQNLVALGKP